MCSIHPCYLHLFAYRQFYTLVSIFLILLAPLLTNFTSETDYFFINK